jgi:nucleoside-diphosphate-sugar epimerase
MSHTAQPVLVLGANGFVGRQLVRHLAAAEGLRPVMAARTPPPMTASGIEWRAFDARDPAAVAAACAGIGYAVNCVAGNGEAMVEATRNLCRAARASGLRRIVHLSSMAVYGSATGLVDEARPFDEAARGYARAKIDSERLMQDFIAAGGDAVILRPGCIHGPHSEQWTGRIGRLLRQHRIGDLGAAGDGICNLVPVEDVAVAIIAALRQPGIGGEAFNLGDPDPGTWNAYFIRFARAIGATPVSRVSSRWLRLETMLLAPPLKLLRIAGSRAGLGRHVPDSVARSLRTLWQQEIQLDHRKADARLGFVRTPPDLALARAAAWFTAAG